MSRFTQKEEPLGRFNLKGDLFILAEPVCYEVGGLGSGEPIEIPSGFVTDFASIPDFALPIIGREIGRRAAIVHDYLYQNLGLGKYSRAKCDSIFLEAMGILDVSLKKRLIMYLAVRLFGWITWEKYKNGTR